MRITRLRVRDLKVHRDLDLELAPGLTVVRGPNEAGKTTIQRALELAPLPQGDGERRGDRRPPQLGRRRRRPAVGRPRVRPGGPGRDPERHAREGLPRRQGHRPPRPRRRDHHRPGPRRRDPGRADRHPHREVLPVDGLGPPPRGRTTWPATRARSATASRPRSAAPIAAPAPRSAGSSARSTTSRRRATKNPGRLRVAEKAVAARGGRRRPGRGAARPARARPRRARRAPASGGPPPSTPSPSGARSSRRPARRSASPRSAAVAQERFDRYRQAVAVADEITELEASHPSSNPLPVLRQLVERLRRPRPGDRRRSRCSSARSRRRSTTRS